ncbi:MAG: hypothetical protein WBP55_09110, partial [Solirubrobacterales bacterium]
MRESSGRSSRLSTKLKTTVLAFLAVLMVGAIGTSSATAAQQLELSFNDSWIKVDSLESLGTSTFHALDPASDPPLSVDVAGALAENGDFLAPPASFEFPDQEIDGGEGIGVITLSITAAKDITGNFNQASGAFTGVLPVTLTVDAPGFGVKCAIENMNIQLASSGSADFGEEAGTLSGTPLNNGQIALLGSWTGVTIDDVTDVAPTPAGTCALIIGGLIGEADSFDGSIWLSGSAVVSGEVDPTECPAGQVGTPPNCVDDEGPKTAAAFTKVKVSPAKGTIKAGKKLTLKVKVTNSGGTDGTAKIVLKSSNKQVKAPKTVKVKVAAGKTVTKKITLKAGKKAKGKAVVTAK